MTLTRQQAATLLTIHDALRKTGIAPSHEEIRRALGFRSKSNVSRLLKALESKGYIRRLIARNRAIEVLRLPGDADPDRSGGPGAVVRHAGYLGADLGPHPETVAVPFALGATADHVAFTVADDAMVEAGIFPGDIVVVCRDLAVLFSGQIVVAAIDHGEAVLRRYRRRRDAIAIEAANPAYETWLFRPDRVEIIGRVVGMVRSYQMEGERS